MRLSPSRRLFRCLGVGVLLLAAAAVGCSGDKPRLTLNGSVSYKGQPVTAGRVRLLSADNQNTWMADLHADGTFVMSDVFPGEVKAAIQDDPRAPKKKVREAELAPGEGQRSGGSVELPAKYKDVNTSGLKYDITPRMRELKIDIP